MRDKSPRNGSCSFFQAPGMVVAHGRCMLRRGTQVRQPASDPIDRVSFKPQSSNLDSSLRRRVSAHTPYDNGSFQSMIVWRKSGTGILMGVALLSGTRGSDSDSTQ